MKIAVVGAEGSGKSTVAKAVAEAARLTLLPSPRDATLAGSGYHTLYEWVRATDRFGELLERQVADEARLASGVIDNGAVDLWAFFQRWEWNRWSPERAERLRELTAAATATYTHVLVTAPRVVAGYAPARFRNALNAAQGHRLVTAFLSEIVPAAKVHALPAGDEAAVLRAAVELVRV
jgi:hypothetical protein